MFGKLIKYEWTAMIRGMLPIYIAVEVMALVNAILFGGLLRGDSVLMESIRSAVDMGQAISILIYMGLLLAMVVFSAIIIIQRFYKGLLQDEGYLMFTLPVKIWQLVLSKALVSLAMFILSCIAALFSIGCFTGLDFFVNLAKFPKAAADVLALAFHENAGMAVQGLLIIMELMVLALLGVLSAIYHLYVSMALGQMARVHKAAMSVVWYVVIGTAGSIVSFQYMSRVSLLPIFQNVDSGQIMAVHLMLCLALLVNLAELAAEFAGTNFILSKKLNLE